MTVDSKKNKSQGMYPTPTPLTDKLIKKFINFSFYDLNTKFLEPGAGDGNFIISYWEYCKESLSKRDLNKAISNTIAFENDEETFRKLTSRLNHWLKANEVSAKPTIQKVNFLTEAEKYLNKKESFFVAGNPPWDEFTTRKHDDLSDSRVAKIRSERDKEGQLFKPFGYKNMYQAFIHKLLELQVKNLEFVLVLPRQILGDKSSSSLRERMLFEGDLKINVYANKDHPDFEFPFVDRNFEVAIVNFKTSSRLSLIPEYSLKITRGFGDKYHATQPVGEDLTIPCPTTKDEMPVIFELLKSHSLASWMDNYELDISMGKVKHNDANYEKCLSGKKISAYQIKNGSSYKLVVNKILPNSSRKIKAALVPAATKVNESLIEISCDDDSVVMYLYLMLNSKFIEGSLRALMSNINLNIFRLVSLPIPAPTAESLRLAVSLVKKIEREAVNPNSASSAICGSVFTLKSSASKVLENQYVDHETRQITRTAA